MSRLDPNRHPLEEICEYLAARAPEFRGTLERLRAP